MKKKIKRFLNEINIVLSPVLQVEIYQFREGSNVCSFDLKLANTSYAMRESVSVEHKAFKELVNSLFQKHFGCLPSFNNTSRTFWTMKKATPDIKDLSVYQIIHSHKHGSDNHIVLSKEYPTEEEVIEKLNLDFDKDDNRESIEILDFGDYDSIKII